MTLVSWLIVIIPLAFIMWAAFYSKRYVRDIADYLACGRLAGRYVISVGDLTAGLSVITLVMIVEQNYQCGMAMGFWSMVNIPVGIFMSLTGYCVYRYRQTRCLSIGQFFEQRYSRPFRIVAAATRTFAEMVTNAIGPAIAVRFFIYFMGIPHNIHLFGCDIPTYSFLVGFLLILALAIVWPAGRISLLITDCFQGIISYPIFVVITVFILTQISWFGDVAPVMLDRVPGESFLNPMDISKLRDFNLFTIMVLMMSTVLNRGSWFGNDTSNSGRTPHEQKMAGILGTWRNGFAMTMLILVAIFVIVFMLSGRFSNEANDVRKELSRKVAEEVLVDPATREQVLVKVDALKPAAHEIGVDAPYSRENNPDTKLLEETIKPTIRENNTDNGHANAVYQKFRTLYNQMMMPVMLGNVFPPVLMGLFALLMVMLLLSTDDSRIFNASSTVVQDVIMPLKKKAMSTKEHLLYLRLCSLGVVIFFFLVSLFFVQLDYILMFITLMCGVWLGGAGPIMIGGLYTRFGNTVGAWCALIFGSGSSLAGLICKRNWADVIYPWLEQCNYVEPVGQFLETVSSPFAPWVVWKMDAVKFPINGMEIYFISMVLGILAYTIGSLVTYKKPYNLDRLLHRGKYSDGESLTKKKSSWTPMGVVKRIVGINSEYTKGDKVIAWSVFIWCIVYSFGIMFCGVLLWNIIWPWPAERWGVYFFISVIVTALSVGAVSTVWFLIGGIIDTRALLRDLAKRVANPLDDGRVVGHVSLADKAHFDEIEHETEVSESSDVNEAKDTSESEE